MKFAFYLNVVIGFWIMGVGIFLSEGAFLIVATGNLLFALFLSKCIWG